MISSKHCTMDDMRQIDLQPAQLSENPLAFFPAELSDKTFNEILKNTARTLECDGRPIACYGITIRWPGLGEVWGMFSQTALEHPATLARDVRKWLEVAEESFALRRIQTSAPEAHAAAHRWLLHLGFVPEARLVGYGIHGETHILYGRIK